MLSRETRKLRKKEGRREKEKLRRREEIRRERRGSKGQDLFQDTTYTRHNSQQSSSTIQGSRSENQDRRKNSNTRIKREIVSKKKETREILSFPLIAIVV